jgi:hypothetical protein
MSNERMVSMKKRPSQLFLYEQYKRMAMKLAWKYWKMLPLSSKMWIDPEDFIAEAVLHVVGFVRRNHNASRASVSSFLYCTVGSHMFNAVLSQRSAKRFCWRVSLEDESCPAIPYSEKLFQLVETKQALEKVFSQASPGLKTEIGRWFGAERRAPGYSRKTVELIKEFGFLAKRNRLSESDCRLLLRSGVWIP